MPLSVFLGLLPLVLILAVSKYVRDKAKSNPAVAARIIEVEKRQFSPEKIRATETRLKWSLGALGLVVVYNVVNDLASVGQWSEMAWKVAMIVGIIAIALASNFSAKMLAGYQQRRAQKIITELSQ